MSAGRGPQYSLDNAKGRVKLVDGKLLFIWGGEGEREPSQQEPPADDADTKDKVEQEPPEVDDDDKDPPEDKTKTGEKSLEEQLDDEKRLRQKAERELAKKNKAITDAEADKDAVKDRDRYKAKVEARDKFLTENLLVMEINKQKKFNFIDVDDVIRAFKPDEVHIDLDADEPSVEGLDLALKRIAKDKPHFLKKDKEEEDGSDRPPSGDKAGGGRTASDDAEDKRLGEKFKLPGYGTQNLRVM